MLRVPGGCSIGRLEHSGNSSTIGATTKAGLSLEELALTGLASAGDVAGCAADGLGAHGVVGAIVTGAALRGLRTASAMVFVPLTAGQGGNGTTASAGAALGGAPTAAGTDGAGIGGTPAIAVTGFKEPPVAGALLMTLWMVVPCVGASGIHGLLTRTGAATGNSAVRGIVASLMLRVPGGCSYGRLEHGGKAAGAAGAEGGVPAIAVIGFNVSRVPVPGLMTLWMVVPCG